ncbi:glutathione S-transferase [Vibrio sp. Isolate25]|uniref:glutathione S-transferase family protein n=1 Tax=Vibrio sp. Isolate25 TaxID=2908535 RepID=UPI001EFDF36B|nr:glutathione S-transferase [Vibrio sp. Isolate25]MCG9596065.1 glutathione S-transferase [Vibrio sp. Isolate25]
MIKLHHLNQSRSKRIIWLLEELGVNYEVVPYHRDSVTFLAPPELKAIHPLGKSPVIEEDGHVITESGAITEYLIDKYAADRLAPPKGSSEHLDYLQWLHFAESSAALPLLLKTFIAKDGAQMNFLPDYAEIELHKVMSYVDQRLENKRYLVADKLTGADIMMSFIVDILTKFGLLESYTNIIRYASQIKTHDSWNKAEQLEVKFG